MKLPRLFEVNPKALEVLHCDNHLLVVNKPAGIGVVPDDSGDESLLDQAKAHIKLTYQKPGAVFLGVVHRIDRPVSGVVVFARTSKAAARLSDAFRKREIGKTYRALCEGLPAQNSGRLELWLRKDRSRNRVSVVSEGTPEAQLSETRYSVMGSSGAVGWLNLTPRTGRSHQLRVAARSLGCPLLGDLKYGASRPLEDQSIGLHARELRCVHPVQKTELCFVSPLPELAIWDALRRAKESR